MSELDLSKFTLFGSLSKSDLNILQRLMVVETHPARHVFLAEGERGSAVTSNLYLILAGAVNVSAQVPRRGDTHLRTMKPGQIFGLVSFLDDGRRSATCTAKTEVTTARLGRSVFRALYQRHGGVHARFQMAVAQQLTGDIRGLERLLVDASEGDSDAIHQRFRPT